ncbi:hypothetical protein NM688_g1952 [Phlebia brevispora]|uniref:Uncharacterized protein n=1 Tax=Phlebia brevispora TaxID=194682 RepID=A0ACC1T9V6_9APHY|nr:hypothetical protein NM688_g1952 [Phlebia brevispora]
MPLERTWSIWSVSTTSSFGIDTDPTDAADKSPAERLRELAQLQSQNRANGRGPGEEGRIQVPDTFCGYGEYPSGYCSQPSEPSQDGSRTRVAAHRAAISVTRSLGRAQSEPNATRPASRSRRLSRSRTSLSTLSSTTSSTSSVATVVRKPTPPGAVADPISKVAKWRSSVDVVMPSIDEHGERAAELQPNNSNGGLAEVSDASTVCGLSQENALRLEYLEMLQAHTQCTAAPMEDMSGQSEGEVTNTTESDQATHNATNNATPTTIKPSQTVGNVTGSATSTTFGSSQDRLLHPHPKTGRSSGKADQGKYEKLLEEEGKHFTTATVCDNKTSGYPDYREQLVYISNWSTYESQSSQDSESSQECW